MGKDLFCLLLQLYFLALIGRAILSWFPVDSNSPLVPVISFLYSITEPVLAPIRSVLPAAGMIDISYIVLIFGIQLVISALGCRIGLL